MRTNIVIILLLLIYFMMAASAYADNITEDIGPYDISLYGDNNIVEIGDKIYLTGKISPNLFGSYPSSIVILVSAPEGSSADTLMLANPSGNGSFSYTQVADVGGDWEFEALYTGIYSDKISISAVPGDEPKKTTLTLSGWPTFPKVGDEVTFKGRLTDGEGKGLGHKKIVYRLASGMGGCMACNFAESNSWRDAGVSRTNNNGDYYFNLEVVEKGTVEVETTYEGDEGYSPSTSRILSITVYS